MSDIIDCGGTYEVHPGATEGRWYVVNGHTGQVRAEFCSKEEAVEYAEELNSEGDE